MGCFLLSGSSIEPWKDTRNDGSYPRASESLVQQLVNITKGFDWDSRLML
jgi:hypothetical protein